MQIAGSTCTICGRRIIFADEGQFCVKCGIVVHLACQRQAICPVCSGPLRLYEDSANADPGWVRFNSQVDRTSGPAVAVLFVLLALIAVMFALFWPVVRPPGY